MGFKQKKNNQTVIVAKQNKNDKKKRVEGQNAVDGWNGRNEC